MKCLPYDYCVRVVESQNTPRYVRLQMREFIRIVENDHPDFVFDFRLFEKISAILKLMIMPKGVSAGKSMFDSFTGYQWLFVCALLCVKERDNLANRRYRVGVLEIARKNYKSYTCAVIIILLFILEGSYSEFFSVAPDGAISRRIKDSVKEILESSPKIFLKNGSPRFKILRDYIEFVPKGSKMTPLAFSNNRMDSRNPNAFIADEVGALQSNYPVEAMRSGQLNIENPLGVLISTKYDRFDNPFEFEVDYCKKILDGQVFDNSYFSLLYEPDNTLDWQTDDAILFQANPAAIDDKQILEALVKGREQAIAIPAKRLNFITKHCNIIWQGSGTDYFVSVEDLRKCKVDHIDWRGKDVYVGVDLSLSTDNTAVCFCAVENGKVFAECVGFIPADRIVEKSKAEQVDYESLLGENCFSCGGPVIDYGFVEDFVLNIAEKYGVNVLSVGFDRWNCLSSAQKWEKAGLCCVEIKQHSSVLHPATKLLREKILLGEFAYTENLLFELNVQNAKLSYDTNKNMFVNKRASKGKVDLLIGLINALFLAQKDQLFAGDGFFVQTM